MGRRIFAEALRAANLRVEVHDDHFAQAEKDEVWLRQVGVKGWVAITCDQGIRYRQRELSAVLDSGLRTLVFSRGHFTATEMAEAFMRALPRIVDLIESSPGPFIATITRKGELQVIVRR